MKINKENVRKAITVMQRVADNEKILKRQLFYLPYYQIPEGSDLDFLNQSSVCKTEDEVIHECGTTCCFVGWLAVSPEFRELGVSVNYFGAPVDANGNSDIIRKLLGMEHDQYENFIYGSTYRGGEFYGKEPSEITPHDVIRKLEELLNGS